MKNIINFIKVKRVVNSFRGYEDFEDAQYVTMRHAVLLLGVSRNTVRKLAKYGLIKSKKLDKKTYYHLGSIRRFIANCKEKVTPLYVVYGSPEHKALGEFDEIRSDKELFEYAEEFERLNNNKPLN